MNHSKELIKKVTRGYQITLPTEFREYNNIDIGSFLSINMVNGKLVIEPLKKNDSAFDKMIRLFENHSEQYTDEEKLLEEIREEVKKSRSDLKSK